MGRSVAEEPAECTKGDDSGRFAADNSLMHGTIGDRFVGEDLHDGGLSYARGATEHHALASGEGPPGVAQLGRPPENSELPHRADTSGSASGVENGGSRAARREVTALYAAVHE